MHADKARKVGTGLAAAAATAVIVNFINFIINTEGSNPQGVLTFLYTASVFALIGSIFMIVAFVGNEHHREKI